MIDSKLLARRARALLAVTGLTAPGTIEVLWRAMEQEGHRADPEILAALVRELETRR